MLKKRHTPFDRFFYIGTSLLYQLAQMSQNGSGELGRIRYISIDPWVFRIHKLILCISNIWKFSPYFFTDFFFIRSFSSSTPKEKAIEK